MLHELARRFEVAAADSAERTERAFGQLRKEGQLHKSQEALLWRNQMNPETSPASWETTKKTVFLAERTP